MNPFAAASVVVISAVGVAQQTLRVWGDNYLDTAVGEVAPAALSAHWGSLLVLRNDGRIFARGLKSGLFYSPSAQFLANPPALPSGSSYLRVTCGSYTHGALVGRESSYMKVASGCAGSMAPARLVPRDTPQIGCTLEVGLLDLPANLAAMVMGWTRLQPGVLLDGVGMPGCVAHASVDGVALLLGSGGEATWSLATPYQSTLLGLRFYNQAFVFDPAAGNAIGAVVSDASEALVGG